MCGDTRLPSVKREDGKRDEGGDDEESNAHGACAPQYDTMSRANARATMRTSPRSGPPSAPRAWNMCTPSSSAAGDVPAARLASAMRASGVEARVIPTAALRRSCSAFRACARSGTRE
eukprot:IDg18107t1